MFDFTEDNYTIEFNQNQVIIEFSFPLSWIANKMDAITTSVTISNECGLNTSQDYQINCEKL